MKAIRLALPLFFLLSCAGLDSRYLESLDNGRLEELRTLDTALLDFTMNGDRALLARVLRRVSELLKGDLPNREYKAELLGLLGLAQYYSGETEAAAKSAVLAERESAGEARLYLIRALLLGDAQKQIAYLSDSLARTAHKAPLLLMLAAKHFDEGDYRKSLAEFDEALPALAPRYREHYQPKRDLAFRFIDRPPASSDTREYLTKPEITLEDLIVITLRETRYLEAIATGRNVPAAALLPALETRGFIRDRSADPGLAVTRRDAAYFIVRLLAQLENDPGLPDRHAGAVRAGTASPVPDVSTGDYFYSAVLVLVERELLDLPDGRRFFPNRTMSGAEYFEVVKKLKTRYPR